jgi:hypothetical protein
MRRATTLSTAKKKRVKVQPLKHWRALAIRQFPEHEEFVSSKDEEYGIYNLFFQLRGQFTEAIARSDVETAMRILEFSSRCLRSKLASDGEDISVAAGVSLFEHIFADSPRERWPIIFSVMPRSVYRECRHYVEQWMGSESFTKLDQDASEFYG